MTTTPCSSSNAMLANCRGGGDRGAKPSRQPCPPPPSVSGVRFCPPYTTSTWRTGSYADVMYLRGNGTTWRHWDHVSASVLQRESQPSCERRLPSSHCSPW